jgi:hypothetical protein
MAIQLKRSFSTYVAFGELSCTAHGRKFLAIFPLQVEGANQMQDRRDRPRRRRSHGPSTWEPPGL